MAKIRARTCKHSTIAANRYAVMNDANVTAP